MTKADQANAFYLQQIMKHTHITSNQFAYWRGETMLRRNMNVKSHRSTKR